MSGKQEPEPTDPRLIGELAIARDHMDLIKIAADASRELALMTKTSSPQGG
jgi:hypothetical protein